MFTLLFTYFILSFFCDFTLHAFYSESCYVFYIMFLFFYTIYIYDIRLLNKERFFAIYESEAHWDVVIRFLFMTLYLNKCVLRKRYLNLVDLSTFALIFYKNFIKKVTNESFYVYVLKCDRSDVVRSYQKYTKSRFDYSASPNTNK